ncbi:thiol oxidoreductase, partial [Candidatus Binatia bacterium]|nr:thiol oxidoreductase [Candidatus Binatia bacterium]
MRSNRCERHHRRPERTGRARTLPALRARLARALRTPLVHVAAIATVVCAALATATPAAAAASAAIVPLYDASTPRGAPLIVDTPAARITRWSDRARDRHARESQFHAYEHYLSHYWEHRSAAVEITDTIGKGGSTITFDVTTQWKLHPGQEELRLFFRGINTVAEYLDNRTMTALDDLHYTHTVSSNPRTGRALQVGDAIELELSQFLDAPPRGRANYYGTAMLYVAGSGFVPWEGTGPLRDSRPIALAERIGGGTTVHRNESDEPESLLQQLTQNAAPDDAQPFLRGRRVQHTSFADGTHDESSDNPVWARQAGKLGPLYASESCTACHPRNGRALPPAPGSVL